MTKATRLRRAARRVQANVGLRDEFAGRALAGYMIWYWYRYPETVRPDNIDAAVVAEHCYQVADAMLTQRNKKQSNTLFGKQDG